MLHYLSHNFQHVKFGYHHRSLDIKDDNNIMGNEQSTVGKFKTDATTKPIQEWYRTYSCNIISVCPFYFFNTVINGLFGSYSKDIVIGCLHRPDSKNYYPFYGLLSIKS